MTKRHKANEWYMGLSREERKVVGDCVRSIAEIHLQVGDRITRAICGGRIGTFTFTHWEGHWACGKAVDDCSPLCIFKVNGQDVNFLADEYKYRDGVDL